MHIPTNKDNAVDVGRGALTPCIPPPYVTPLIYPPAPVVRAPLMCYTKNIKIFAEKNGTTPLFLRTPYKNFFKNSGIS